MKKVLKFLFSRMCIVGVLILIQAMILASVILKISDYFVYFYAFCTLLSIAAVLYILSTTANPSYKLAWTIPILIIPVFGGLFYLMFGMNNVGKRLRKQMKLVAEQSEALLVQDMEVLEEIGSQDKRILTQVNYIKDCSLFPIYRNTTTKYLSPGEVFFDKLKEELEKAEHFIFMEYFIIQEGVMWDGILEILTRKAAEGVDVRVMYDDVGTIQTLPYKYNEKLEQLGIKTAVFNEITAALSLKMNNRDHRKITVIDGHTGFTGGINLADEYINEYEKHGHWKDAALMMKGEAVWNLTLMFLQIWNFERPEKDQYDDYRPRRHHPEPFESDGYVQPYADSPLDGEVLGENVYLNIINKAKDYVYINTPYLIVDNELVTALTLAAKGGIDVRIVTPHHADKWFVHILTRAYYPQLIEAGVKVYEYTPGFIHSKTFVSDDEVGVVGTINLDFRSLYLHFECATWMYKTKAVHDMKQDFLKTLKLCQEITLEEAHHVRWYNRLIRSILRVFSPLM
ncbi:MAG: cardiolipin synthase [Cellulosilyticaceae bacterium]